MDKRTKGDRKVLVIFVIGLLIVLILAASALWLYLEVDAAWMLSYFFVPDQALLGLLLAYVAFYILGYSIADLLAREGWDRFLLFISAVIWVIYTICTFDRFYWVSGEWFWEITIVVDNFMWIPIPPTSLGPLFLMFFIASFVLFGFFLIVGVYHILHKANCRAQDPDNRGELCYVG
jgi:hypothetical protein